MLVLMLVVMLVVVLVVVERDDRVLGQVDQGLVLEQQRATPSDRHPHAGGDHERSQPQRDLRCDRQPPQRRGLVAQLAGPGRRHVECSGLAERTP